METGIQETESSTEKEIQPVPVKLAVSGADKIYDGTTELPPDVCFYFTSGSEISLSDEEIQELADNIVLDTADAEYKSADAKDNGELTEITGITMRWKDETDNSRKVEEDLKQKYRLQDTSDLAGRINRREIWGKLPAASVPYSVFENKPEKWKNLFVFEEQPETVINVGNTICLSDYIVGVWLSDGGAVNETAVRKNLKEIKGDAADTFRISMDTEGISENSFVGTYREVFGLQNFGSSEKEGDTGILFGDNYLLDYTRGDLEIIPQDGFGFHGLYAGNGKGQELYHEQREESTYVWTNGCVKFEIAEEWKQYDRVMARQGEKEYDLTEEFDLTDFPLEENRIELELYLLQSADLSGKTRTNPVPVTIGYDGLGPAVTFDISENINQNPGGGLTYGEFIRDRAEISIEAEDLESGMQEAKWTVWKEDEDLTSDALVSALTGKNDAQLVQEGILTEDDKTRKWRATIPVPEDSEEGYYLVAADTADHAGNRRISISNGLVLDRTAPEISDIVISGANGTELVNGFYTGDINVNFHAADSGDVKSGLSEVLLEVKKEEDTGNSELLYEAGNAGGNQNLTIADMKGAEYRTPSDSGIRISGKANDSNQVVVRVGASDLAGNMTTSETSAIRIDTTRPEAAVSVQGIAAAKVIKEGQEYTCFEGTVVAEIVFTERNFDRNQVSVELGIGDETGELVRMLDPSDSESLKSYGITARWKADSEAGREEKDYTRFRTNVLEIYFTEERDYVIREVSCIDRAGWENSSVDFGTIRRFMIDNTAPVNPEITVITPMPENGIYCDDINLEIRVEETVTHASCSGLKKVWYEVICDDKKTQGECFEIEGHQSCFQMKGSNGITVDSSKNDSNHVTVRVYVSDYSGKESVQSLNLAIDISPPVVDVTYDLNTPANGFYYNEVRTAAITVKERNFNPDDMGVRFLIEQTGEKAPVFSEWTVGKYEGDQTIHQCTVTFSEDDDYCFTFSVTDMAGNKTEYGKKDQFTIDRTAPVVRVSYENDGEPVVPGENKNSRIYRQGSILMQVSITEHNFHSEKGIRWMTNREKISGKFADEGDVRTAVVEFTEDGYYNTEFHYTDLAGNRAVFVDHTGRVLKENPKGYFAVDNTAPMNGRITIEPFGTWGTFSGFRHFGKGNSFPVSIAGEDELSGPPMIFYYIEEQAGSVLTEEQLAKVRWVKGSRAELKKEGQYIVYAKLVDKAGNIRYVNSDGVIIDRSLKKPVLEAVTKASASGIYSGDVTIHVSAEDLIKNHSCSGLKNVRYEILNDGKVTQKGKFLSGTSAGAKILKRRITVNSKKNNSNHVTVRVYAEDQAGNQAQTELKLRIDITKPVIMVTYDKNVPKNGRYYNTVRTATVTVRERNFDEGGIRWLVKNTDGISPQIGKWMHGVEAGDNTLHRCKIRFRADGDYTFTLSAADQAENKKNYGHVDRFTIDRTPPVVKVTYRNQGKMINVGNDENSRIYKTGSITMQIEITEHNFRDSSGIVWTSNGRTVSGRFRSKDNIRTAEVKFQKDGDYTTAFSYTDLAGNKANIIANGWFTVDNTAPVCGKVVIEPYGAWDTFLGFHYFSRDQKLTATISGEDALSGEPEIDWYQSTEPLSAKQLVLASWNRGNTVSIVEEGKYIIYGRLKDKAGNISYVSSDGVIMDRSIEKPELTILTKPSMQNIYSEDVEVNIQAADAWKQGSCSGLRNVRYEVRNHGVVTQRASVQVEKYQRSLSTVVTVDSQKNNSNDVTVEVFAEDYAGNTVSVRRNLMIDVTEPQISVSYDLNAPQNGKYYRAVRTATISIRERNFDPDKVRLEIWNPDGTKFQTGTWIYGRNENNADHTEYRCQITFPEDGNYRMALSAEDQAGNRSVYRDQEIFVIDRTEPVIHITYDYNTPGSGNYFASARTAVITVKERNFDPDHIIFNYGSGKDMGQPVFTQNGDVHTAVLSFVEDGYYEFRVEAVDLAGNKSRDGIEEVQRFYVDTSKPEIRIRGIKAANKDKVMPEIVIRDSNYDPNGVEITLQGLKHKAVEAVQKESTGMAGGVKIVLEDMEYTKDKDDVYTLTIRATDKAGNLQTETAVYSVNRFGSAYDFDDYTKKVLENYYNQMPQSEKGDIVIYEYNVDTLEMQEIECTFNGKLRRLKRGEDYTAEEQTVDGQKKFTYRILRKNFSEDGLYTVNVFSKDAAQNASGNHGQNKEIEFVVDNTPPDVVVSGIHTYENGGKQKENTKIRDAGIYNKSSHKLTIDVKDNIQISRLKIEVYTEKEGKKVLNKNISREVTVKELAESFGIVSLELEEYAGYQFVNIVAVDQAGNRLGYEEFPGISHGIEKEANENAVQTVMSGEPAPAAVKPSGQISGRISDRRSDENTEKYVYRILISTNIFVRWYMNRRLFLGTLGLIAAAVVLLSRIISKIRLSDKDE
ncbi:MAG: Ig-like domain repeat protein [Lachnospiraceae bacterium]|nr:Ig-like domain repeat protein [Lachnospiraceae bacterium]